MAEKCGGNCDKCVRRKMAEKYSGENVCAREKYWSEIDSDEKIERVRRRLKSNNSRIDAISKQVVKNLIKGYFKNV